MTCLEKTFIDKQFCIVDRSAGRAADRVVGKYNEFQIQDWIAADAPDGKASLKAAEQLGNAAARHHALARFNTRQGR